MNEVLCQLSLLHYSSILSSVKKKYDIVPFCDSELATSSNKPKIILRHDIDSSLHNTQIMGQMENTLGIRSTYFVQLHCDYYSSTSLEGLEHIRALRDLGHEVGLHYDPVYYDKLGITFESGISKDIESLETILGRPVVSVSRHLPLLGGQKETFPPSIKFNAMNPIYINGRYKYLSDSNGVFREGCFCNHIDNLRDYCFLVHPVWWTTEGNDWKEKLKHQAELDCNLARSRIENKICLYEKILDKRSEYDAKLIKSLNNNANSFIISNEYLAKHVNEFIEILSDIPDEYWKTKHFLLPIDGKYLLSRAIEQDGKMVAYAIATFKNDNIHINKLMVDKNFRSRGLGKQLIQDIENSTHAKKCKFITLKVSYNNNRAISFYTNNGFEIYGEFFDNEHNEHLLEMRKHTAKAHGQQQ